MTTHLPEKSDSLWRVVAAPSLWALHFLVSYATAAVFCAKSGGDASLGPVRVTIAVLTLVALAGTGVIGWGGYRRHRLPGGALPHDDDTPEDRHRFLGFATLLLAGLSAIAIVYQALAIVFIRSCR